MRTIKIINGVYGHRSAGSKFIEPKRAGDPPFQVEDAKAERLVALKIAEYTDIVSKLVPAGVATASEDTNRQKTGDYITNDRNGSDDKVEHPEAPKYNVEMKASELRELMEGCGLTYKVGMSKADMVATLDAYFGDEVEDEDEDTPPDLGAEDPIV